MFKRNDQGFRQNQKINILGIGFDIFRKPKKTECFFGIKKNQSEEIIDDEKSIFQKCDFFKAWVHVCGVHIKIKLFKPDENRQCWIKFLPTFKGLKQVI